MFLAALGCIPGRMDFLQVYPLEVTHVLINGTVLAAAGEKVIS